ncbi:MAG: pyrroline-5-carboxylate reductase, partial [Ruminococcus sp.]|nr:pyrroline-5-carboxylate reductase [Ruminococcus sp.]
TALAKGKYTAEEEFETAAEIFRTGGSVEFLPMDKMKEVIAINGSSPAFIYLYAKGFIDYADSVGIDKDTALRLFAGSLTGSAAMLTDSGKTVDELIKMVSSPGGTTLAGLDALYEADLLKVTADCCGRCTKRAYELSK